jgi:hypothetical protein
MDALPAPVCRDERQNLNKYVVLNRKKHAFFTNNF